jgi:hypothetical protein
VEETNTSLIQYPWAYKGRAKSFRRLARYINLLYLSREFQGMCIHLRRRRHIKYGLLWHEGWGGPVDVKPL